MRLAGNRWRWWWPGSPGQCSCTEGQTCNQSNGIWTDVDTFREKHLKQFSPCPTQSWPASRGGAALHWWTACVWLYSLSPGWGTPQSWLGRKTWRRWRRWTPARRLRSSFWEADGGQRSEISRLCVNGVECELHSWLLTAPPVRAALWWGWADGWMLWCRIWSDPGRGADSHAGRHCSWHWGTPRYCASPYYWTRSAIGHNHVTLLALIDQQKPLQLLDIVQSAMFTSFGIIIDCPSTNIDSLWPQPLRSIASLTASTS